MSFQTGPRPSVCLSVSAPAVRVAYSNFNNAKYVLSKQAGAESKVCKARALFKGEAAKKVKSQGSLSVEAGQKKRKKRRGGTVFPRL